MKKSLTILTLIFCTMISMAQTPETLFEQGNKAYADGDYSQASSIYCEILKQGKVSPELYYNLGNTYYRLDEIGNSIVCYERALKLKPNYRDCRENLELAYSKTQDKIDQIPELFFVRWWKAAVNIFSTTGWEIAFIIILIFGALLAMSVAYFIPRGEHIRTILTSGYVIVALFALCLIGLISSSIMASSHKKAIVVASVAEVKSSPEQNSVEKMYLHSGTPVTIEETIGEWQKIRIADGNTGWVETNSISVI